MGTKEHVMEVLSNAKLVEGAFAITQAVAKEKLSNGDSMLAALFFVHDRMTRAIEKEEDPTAIELCEKVRELLFPVVCQIASMKVTDYDLTD